MFIDNFFLEFAHSLYLLAPNFFTPFFKFITFLGEKAWFFLVIAFLLCLRRKTRWMGIMIIISIFIAFIVADIGLKPLIHRARPYDSDLKNYYGYWNEAGFPEEEGYSMPSGHVLGISCFFFSLFLANKKSKRGIIAIVGIICIILMTLSRMYFMAHYFTDCLVSFILAAIISLITKYIVKYIHSIFKDFENTPFGNFVLNFDIIDTFRS